MIKIAALSVLRDIGLSTEPYATLAPDDLVRQDKTLAHWRPADDLYTGPEIVGRFVTGKLEMLTIEIFAHILGVAS